jgi:sulfatase maturation enzyme AslB (radical SAM superfamily)
MINNVPIGRIHRHTTTIDSLRRRGWCLPVNWEIDLTNKCDLSCRNCASAQIAGDESLDKKQIDEILAKLAWSPFLSITWAGREPLLNPLWRDAMKRALALDIPQGLYSHLPNVTQSEVDFISRHCRFAVCHNAAEKLVNPHGMCRWKCSWMIDETNYRDIIRMISHTNWNLFDQAEFRPIVTIGGDYSYVEDAMRTLTVAMKADKRVTASMEKFQALIEPNFGRHYGACYGIFFGSVVGATGDVYLCCNRRGESIGNIFTETLTQIFSRLQPVTDFSKCPPACRQHTNNKILWDCYMGPAPRDVEFC